MMTEPLSKQLQSQLYCRRPHHLLRAGENCPSCKQQMGQSDEYFLVLWDYDAAPDGCGIYLHSVRGGYNRRDAIHDALYNRDERSWTGIAVFGGANEFTWGTGAVDITQARARIQQILKARQEQATHNA